MTLHTVGEFNAAQKKLQEATSALLYRVFPHSAVLVRRTDHQMLVVECHMYHMGRKKLTSVTAFVGDTDDPSYVSSVANEVLGLHIKGLANQ